jgi:hypothetical protein
MSKTESTSRRSISRTRRHHLAWPVSRWAGLGIILAVALAAAACSPDPSDVTDETDTEVRVQCVGGPKFDPAGVKNVGNGHGRQFIGGQCLSAADCASGCCAKPCGICSGPGAQFQAGKQGCGFRSGKANAQPASRDSGAR